MDVGVAHERQQPHGERAPLPIYVVPAFARLDPEKLMKVVIMQGGRRRDVGMLPVRVGGGMAGGEVG